MAGRQDQVVVSLLWAFPCALIDFMLWIAGTRRYSGQVACSIDPISGEYSLSLAEFVFHEFPPVCSGCMGPRAPHYWVCLYIKYYRVCDYVCLKRSLLCRFLFSDSTTVLVLLGNILLMMSIFYALLHFAVKYFCSGPWYACLFPWSTLVSLKLTAL